MLFLKGHELNDHQAFKPPGYIRSSVGADHIKCDNVCMNMMFNLLQYAGDSFLLKNVEFQVIFRI